MRWHFNLAWMIGTSGMLVAAGALVGCGDSPPDTQRRAPSGMVSSDRPPNDGAPSGSPKGGPARDDAPKNDSPPRPGRRNGEVGEVVKLDTAGGELAVESGLVFTAPEGWGRKQGASQFVEAEFVLPKAEGDEQDGRLTLSQAGGDIKLNVDRWKGQFGGKPEKESTTELDLELGKVTIVDFSGEFDDRRGPFAPPVKRSGYRMWAAIIPLGEGETRYFVKATGPEKTIAANLEKLQAFVKTVKK